MLALLFAYLLSPLVNFLDRLLPSRTRTPALALAYLLFVGVLVLAGSQIGSQVVEQANSLSRIFPGCWKNGSSPSPGASPTVEFHEGSRSSTASPRDRGKAGRIF